MSWKCGETGYGEYGDSLDAGLITPPFFLGPGYVLEFWHWMDAQTIEGQPHRAYDGGMVELSVGGGPFEPISPPEGYPSYIIYSPIPGPFPVYTGVYSGSSDWTRACFNLIGPEGEAQLRFRFGSDGIHGGEGWYVDDVIVRPPTIAGVEGGEQLSLSPAPDRLRLFAPRPNPANPRVTLRFALPEPGPVSLEIFDVTGRLVHVLLKERRAAGLHEVVWDGRNAAGRAAASGIYFCRLSAGGTTDTQALVLAR